MAEIHAYQDVRVDSRLKRAAELGAMPRQLVICGPAGTGKTFGILCFHHCLAADYPGLRIAWIRLTRTSLTESVLKTYEDYVLPMDGAQCLATGASRRYRYSYVFPNGSEIVLGGLDNANKVMSTEWDIIYVNEAIELGDAPWDALWSRLGRPGRPACFGWLLGDTNPGVPGHWIKARAGEDRLTIWNTNHQANPALWDGCNWTEAGLRYRDQLDALRGAARERLLGGNWAANEGLVFGELLDCVVDDVPLACRSGRKVGGIDFGWNHPFAAISGWLHDDILWIGWERYQSFITLPKHAEALANDGTEWWADPSRPESIAELQIAGHLVNPALHYGQSPVQEGIDQVTHRARTGRIKIAQACVNLLRECGTYVYAETGKPADKDNHACDALRYLVRGIDRGRVIVDRTVHVPPPTPIQVATGRQPSRLVLDPDDEQMWM